MFGDNIGETCRKSVIRVTQDQICFIDLHWLPTPKRIPYKICLLMFKCLKGLVSICPSFWSLCWHCCCSGSFWFEIRSSRWSCCAGTQWRSGVQGILLWLVRNVGINCRLDSEICRLVLRLLLDTWKHTCSELFFFWLGAHFWICITFCRVRHNARLIIIK